ncbi:hypothetical protein PCANC_26224 [Puccinia coronata f. sp. avenae]|uniref:Uncharacterized protein n=1 Tax=Puccinia coronata f. sp. avenae TaxID=200324 RepID=A0A2N5RWQ7_9BASI|nr:hypothetical protein PCASD_26347 [Puccinia coronata f. sp. avenae]PLW08554.1 hypothetical protein PCANC_26224 [Puccinia coronata f. sp. avenae]
MGQFDHMAQQPSRCPRLDGGVNYGHFDPQGGPSNYRRGPIAVRHPGILTTWHHGRHLDNMAPWPSGCPMPDGGINVAWETNQARWLIKLGVQSSQSKHLKRKTLLLKIHWSRGSNLTEVTDNMIVGFKPPAMNHEGPIIKTEPNMSNEPTPKNTPHQVHLDFFLYANQQILMDRPCNLKYGEIGYDKLIPREFIPLMEIILNGLTAEQFKGQVSSHLSAHVRYLPVWLIIEEAEEARALEWTYRVQDRVNEDLAFTEERKISGYGDDGFPEFLVVAQASSRMARIHVDLSMARPLPEPMTDASDMEEDQLATLPCEPSVNHTGTRIHLLDENDLSMPDFLAFCKIPRRNPKIWKLLEHHEFHHWLAFQGVTKLDLRRLGFTFGAVQLLHAGVIHYERFLASSESN